MRLRRIDTRKYRGDGLDEAILLLALVAYGVAWALVGTGKFGYALLLDVVFLVGWLTVFRDRPDPETERALDSWVEIDEELEAVPGE